LLREFRRRFQLWRTIGRVQPVRRSLGEGWKGAQSPFAKKSQTIFEKRKRIESQWCDVDQDLFDVFFGLYDVHISTATATSGTRAHIDGIEKASAEEIRKLILSKIH
jgi:hypothetical protein